MKAEYILTSRLRVFFKEPFGVLILGAPEQTMMQLVEKAVKEKPPVIIAVGDVVSQNLHAFNINPLLSIVDGKSLRDQPMPEQVAVDRVVHVENPQGTITEESVAAVKAVLESGIHTHIVVNGEEDLLVLPAILYAPENAFIVYGQPYVGIVVAKATKMRKEQVKEFLKEMKASKS